MCRECSKTGMYVRIAIGITAFLIPAFITASVGQARDVYAKYGATAKDVTRVRVLIAYMQIKLSFPNVMIIQLPQDWVDFMRFFSFLNFDILDIIGTTCITRLGYQIRLQGSAFFLEDCPYIRAVQGLHEEGILEKMVSLEE